MTEVTACVEILVIVLLLIHIEIHDYTWLVVHVTNI